MYNLLIGGAAGQGIDTTVAVLEKLLKRAGYSVFTSRDFMSRIRGGHNFMTIRFSNQPVMAHSNTLDGIVALDELTVSEHIEQLKEDGFILCDSRIDISDKRVIKQEINATAQELGNARVSGSVAVGVILKLFSETIDNVKDVLKANLDDRFLDINIKAVQAGYGFVEERYPKLKGDFGNNMIISGSQAVALGAIAAGLKIYCAYPMSPATAMMVYLAQKGKAAGVVVEQAEDEIAAINMAIGASYAGARAMTGTSGGGFSLMVEAFGLAGIAEIPLVVVNVQRPGPATGLPTRTEQGDLKFMISASQGEFPRMILSPRTHKDAFYQTIRAFDIAEKYQMPVVILNDQFLGDASGSVAPFDISDIEVAEPLKDYEGEYLRYRYTESGISPRLIPGKTKHLVSVDSDEHDEAGKITESATVRIKMADKRMRKLEMLEKELLEPELIGAETFDTLLIGWGSTYGSISEAVGLLNEKGNEKFSALVFGDVFPLPKKKLSEFTPKAKRIINIEMNATGQFAGLIREQTGIICGESVLKYDGRQITADEIVQRILGGA